ncbi:hypothetical protein L211DRAFT_51452 [Terfezia boudieri ATCC MYA-4762]|uniref:Uncharacterized protein n=1 Tax=Terfezia boudieri ATCC MYA-4762 TaxID=1051890 RepID=A0A3N4M8F7_9PEZI|nr:hypothetical protein L211DRAFT_51452 [Terfezia boudieri ATCC MYA-4762]
MGSWAHIIYSTYSPQGKLYNLVILPYGRTQEFPPAISMSAYSHIFSHSWRSCTLERVLDSWSGPTISVYI